MQTYLTIGTSGGVYSKRKEDSILEGFTKKNSPKVSKFIGFLDTTEMESGEKEEDHKNNRLNLYLQTFCKTFDYIEFYAYLSNKTIDLYTKAKILKQKR